MKKFEFTLQPILNMKEQFEKIEIEKLGKAMQELNIQKEKLNELIKEANNISNDSFTKIHNGIKALYISQYDVYLKKLFNLIDQQKNLICKLENDVECIRQNLIKISKEKKMLESVKNRRFDEYRYMLNREQINLIDEQISFKIAKP